MHPRSKDRLGACPCVRILALAMVLSYPVDARAAERLVLMEKFSASWCPHCRNSSQVLGPLIEANPDRFITFDAFISTANNGQYVTDWGVSRGEFYRQLIGSPRLSYPTVLFDGAIFHDGDEGDNEALHDVYQQVIDIRSEVPTDVVIDISALPLGGGMYDVTTTVSLEPGVLSKTMRVHLIQALDNYGLYTDGVTLAHNTVMQSLEDGFDITLLPGQSEQITRTMQLGGASLNQFEDIRLIAWAQYLQGSVNGVEVLNAAQTLLSQAHPADFNGDAVINGADVAVWEDEFGSIGLPHEGADANGDGRVDGSDLLFAQRAFGLSSNGAPAAAAAAAVPEPATASLLVVGILLLAWRYVLPWKDGGIV